MESPANERSERLAIGSILAAAALLRFFGLGRQSLWVDEMLSVNAFNAPAGIPYWKKFFYDVHGPIYALFMHFWSMISGSDVWLRIPSALAGVLAVYLLFRWLRSIGRRDCALPGALFLALSPFHLYYSQELRFYSLLSLFVVITLIAFERFRAEPSPRSGALLGVCFGLTCLSHLSGLFLGAALVLYMICTGRLRGAYLRFGALAAGIALVIVAPWIYREITFLVGIRIVGISTIPVEERLRGDLTLSLWSYPYALYAFSAGYSLGPSLREIHLAASTAGLFARNAPVFLLTGVLFGGLLVSGIVRSSKGGHLGLFLTVIIVTVVSVSLAGALNVKVFNVRYLMCAFPFFIALIAYGLPSRRALRILAIAAACAVMLISDWNYHFNGRYAREDVRGAAKTVVRNEAPGDLLLVPVVGHVFERYYRGANDVVIFPPSPGSTGFDEKMRDYLDEYPRVWYLRSRSWDYDPEEILSKLLTERGRLEGSWDFPGATLDLYISRH